MGSERHSLVSELLLQVLSLQTWPGNDLSNCERSAGLIQPLCLHLLLSVSVCTNHPWPWQGFVPVRVWPRFPFSTQFPGSFHWPNCTVMMTTLQMAPEGLLLLAFTPCAPSHCTRVGLCDQQTLTVLRFGSKGWQFLTWSNVSIRGCRVSWEATSWAPLRRRLCG